MADVQLSNGYIRIANDIWDELIRRDFSKRQKDILFFIYRLSYGCQKKQAYIPKLKHFEFCGVSATQIKTELQYLQGCKVLIWDLDAKTFEINKDYETWQISPVRKWDEEGFSELIALNLEHKKSAKSANENFIKHEVGDEKNFMKREVPESTDFMKHEVFEKENFIKHEVEDVLNPCGSKEKTMPKDIIFKDIQEVEEVEEESRAYETAVDAYYFSFKKYNMTGHIQGYIHSLYKRGISERFVIEVILEMGARGIGPDVTYMEKLAEDWITKGCYTREEARQRREAKGVPRNSGTPAQNRQEQRNDEAARKIREAEERERKRDQEAVYADSERVQQFYL